MTGSGCLFQILDGKQVGNNSFKKETQEHPYL